MATVTCPRCGKEIKVKDPDREFLFCECCGEKVEIAPSVRQAAKDEHRRKKEKARKQIEQEEYSTAQFAGKAAGKFCNFCIKKPKKALLTAAICIVVLGVVSVATAQHQALRAHQEELDDLNQERIGYSHLAQGEAQIPEISSIPLNTRNIEKYHVDYRIAERAFEDAGFTNITLEPSHYSLSYYDKYVFGITVDGLPQLPSGEWHPIDTPIVISYYTCE